MPLDEFKTGGLIEGINQGIRGAVQGFYDAEERQMRKMESEAKLKAQKKAEARQTFMDKVALHGAGLMQDEAGGLIERPLTAREQQDYDYKQSQIAKQARQDRAGEAGKLRRERSTLPTTKDTQKVSASFNRVRKAAENPSPAGDLALIFNYMKMLDPGSTVREGEFANAQNSGSVPTQIMAQYNKVLKGERLTGGQRTDFLNQAQGQYSAQTALQKKVDEKFRQIAEANGLPIDRDWETLLY